MATNLLAAMDKARGVMAPKIPQAGTGGFSGIKGPTTVVNTPTQLPVHVAPLGDSLRKVVDAVRPYYKPPTDPLTEALKGAGGTIVNPKGGIAGPTGGGGTAIPPSLMPPPPPPTVYPGLGDDISKQGTGTNAFMKHSTGVGGGGSSGKGAGDLSNYGQLYGQTGIQQNNTGPSTQNFGQNPNTGAMSTMAPLSLGQQRKK